MTPSFWNRFTELENILFFLGGVVVSGFISGVIQCLRERRVSNIVVRFDDASK
jgi:hypothetical protein